METTICDRCKKDLQSPARFPRLFEVTYYDGWVKRIAGKTARYELCSPCFAGLEDYLRYL
jgi:hypothetical protein